MLIALHKNARTTPAVRAEIAASNETASSWPSALASPSRQSTNGRSGMCSRTRGPCSGAPPPLESPLARL